MDPSELHVNATALGYDSERTAVIEFTAVRMGFLSDFTRVPAMHGQVERRLQNMMEEAGTLPVEGRYWPSLDSFVKQSLGVGGRPAYDGPIDRSKAFEFRLYEPGAPIIRVYADGTFFPQRTT